MSQWYEWRDAPKAEYGVIGDPIAHSWSPDIHRAAFRALALPFRYEAIRVPPAEFVEAIQHLRDVGYRGLNVTVPHKERAAAWIEDRGTCSARYRSVNTLDLKSGQGTSTDGEGFVDSLVDLEISAPSHVLVLGAGGASRSLIPALLSHGFSVAIWNRTASKAQELVVAVGQSGATVAERPDPHGANLIVNATSASLQEASLPVDWTRAESGSLAYDLAYGSQPTPFMSAASAAGLRTTDGRPMLVAQAARSLAWWLDIEPPVEAMREAVRSK